MRKVIDAIAIVSFLLSGTVVGLIGYAYLTLTNEKKQEEIKSYIMEQAQDLIKDQIGNSIPSLPESTGPVKATPALPRF
tara:strand:+ start:577 stop:813 length:237 start_codon:yes stop_codon:yes gene_type:complete